MSWAVAHIAPGCPAPGVPDWGSRKGSGGRRSRGIKAGGGVVRATPRRLPVDSSAASSSCGTGRAGPGAVELSGERSGAPHAQWLCVVLMGQATGFFALLQRLVGEFC